jgi:uncharacterized protein YycO
MNARKTFPPLIVLLVLLTVSSPVSAYGLAEKGPYDHPEPGNLLPGDIALGHAEYIGVMIPGYWDHAGMIVGYNATLGDWMVIEGWGLPSGVRIVSLSDFMSRYPDVVILRVNTSQEIRDKAVEFALQQLGKPYDYKWWKKEIYGDSYYCSELVWASYMVASNGEVDLDANPGWTLTYLDGVAPQEIYDDGYTYVIYYDGSS